MTIDTLPTCVTHHWENGDISNQGIYNSLLAKADAALAANKNGQTNTAINILNAFIHEVSAQNSKKITSGAAVHMINHAKMAIDQL